MSESVTFQALDSFAEIIRANCSDGIMESVDSAVIIQAISEAARANGMAKTAREAGHGQDFIRHCRKRGIRHS